MLTITPQVTSLTGTANRVTVSAANGAVTLSGPQDLGTSSTVQFGSTTVGSLSTSGVITCTNATASSNTTTGAVLITGGVGVQGNVYAAKVYNAVWNDIADFIEVDENTEIEFGKAYYRNNDYKILKTTKYTQQAIGIASDTYGFGVGQKKNKKQIPIAIGGWVLAFTDKIYKPGTPLVATKHGVLTKARWYTVILNSDKIIAHFDRPELEAVWNGIEVNTRNWVKVRG